VKPHEQHRKAFAELYSERAGNLAEQMGRLREKEGAKRDRFKRSVERYIPTAVLTNMGLLAPPPHCQVAHIRRLEGTRCHLAGWPSGSGLEVSSLKTGLRRQLTCCKIQSGADTPC